MFDETKRPTNFKKFKESIAATWNAYFPNSQPTYFSFVKEVPKRNIISFYSLINKKMDPLRWSKDKKVYFDIDRNIFIKI